MALPMQRSLLRSFVQSMHEEGIVNDDFYQLLAMKETVRPDYVVRAVTSYCLSAQNLFSHLTYHICQPEVDYHQVNTAACEFYARTSSIGAEHVKLSCAELIQACQENDKEYCSRALYWTKNEYSKLRRKFETLVQNVCYYICDVSQADRLVHLYGYDEICSTILNRRNHKTIICYMVKAYLRIKDKEGYRRFGKTSDLITSYDHESVYDYLMDARPVPVTLFFGLHAGILSDQNSHIQTLTMVEEPYYAEQFINTYCTSVEAILLQLTSCIELRDVDFSQLVVLARQIEEKSSRFGAEHVRRACADLIRACDQMHKGGVSRALAWLKNEYTLTKNKLQSVAQMERRIMRLLLKEEKRQQQP